MIRRHLRLYFAFWRNCLRQAVEFRANFWANILTNFGWLLVLVLFLKLIYSNTRSVAGWSEAEMFLLVGTYSTVRAIADTIFSKNLSEIPSQIQMGTMDFTLLRPVDSQFFISLRYVSLASIGQFVGALAMLSYGVSLARHNVEPIRLLAYLVLLACAVALFYAISLMTMTLSFWFVRLDNLFVALDTMFSVARTPIDVFRAWGRLPQLALTYILPLAFIATVPTKMLFGHVPLLLTIGSGIALAAGFLALSTLFWRFATRAYSSASS